MTNYYALAGFIIRILAILYIGFYIGSKQLVELQVPKDGLTKLRQMIMIIICLTAISAIPTLAFQFSQLGHPFINNLQKLSAITGNLSYAGLAILWGLIYKYKEDEWYTEPMTLQQFVDETTGKSVTYDGLKENWGQCEQLVCLYWKQVYGFICPPIPAAKDLWINPTVLGSFGRVPIGQEVAGDVAVFGASSAINSPIYGHTDIVLGKGFQGFDSNWGNVNDTNPKSPTYGYPVAHKVQHSYIDVLGFLRWKGGDMAYVTDEELADLKASKNQLQDALAWKKALQNSDLWPLIDGDADKIQPIIKDLIATKKKSQSK